MKMTSKNSVGNRSASRQTAPPTGGRCCGRKFFDGLSQPHLFKVITPVLYLILPIIFLFAETSLGQTWLDTRTDSLIRSGIGLSIQHDYSRAESIFQQLIRDHPDHPLGYFFMAATIQAKMMDYESDQWRQDFHHYIRLAIGAAQRNAAANPEPELWSMFYHGSALCYLAFYEGRSGNYLNAISHGLAGISILKKIITVEPEFYDAYFGIGSYQYWRSQKTRLINWLPLVSDDRAEGIRRVRQAIEQGKYTQYAAMNELIWILLDAGQAEEAYGWALIGLGKFPQSRFFLWGAAKSALALENYSAAADHFQQLLASIITSPVDNEYNEYICRVKLAHCFEKLGRWAEAQAQIAITESLPLSAELEQKLKKQRAELIQLKARLTALIQADLPADSSVTKHKFADKQRGQHARQVTQ